MATLLLHCHIRQPTFPTLTSLIENGLEARLCWYACPLPLNFIFFQAIHRGLSNSFSTLTPLGHRPVPGANMVNKLLISQISRFILFTSICTWPTLILQAECIRRRQDLHFIIFFSFKIFINRPCFSECCSPFGDWLQSK